MNVATQVFMNPRKEIRQFFCEDQSYEISRLPPVARDDRRRIPNMAWFTPAEHPDEKYYIFGKEGVVRMAEKYGIQLLGRKSSRNPILTQHLIIPGLGRGFYVEENLNITFNSNIFPL